MQPGVRVDHKGAPLEPANKKRIRKGTCLTCFKFFDKGTGFRDPKTYEEFCTEQCQSTYSKPGTLRADKHLSYAQNLLSSVETRTPTQAGTPVALLRNAKVCARKGCGKIIRNVVQAVGRFSPEGSKLYCTKDCADSDPVQPA